jgi:hypothetical protein
MLVLSGECIHQSDKVSSHIRSNSYSSTADMRVALRHSYSIFGLTTKALSHRKLCIGSRHASTTKLRQCSHSAYH